jgi:anti-sigma regulatory factor (Ser/Thr protein kinase)
VRELALHLLDIAENSIAAGASSVQVGIVEDTKADRLTISVSDDGRGMDEQTVARVVDPFYTTRTTRKVGLGIPLLKEAAEACNGTLRIWSKPGNGARLVVEFQRSHIDRMPLGNVADTMITLLVGAPQIHWILTYVADGQTFTFDDAEMKSALDGLPITEPDILAWLRETLQAGIAEIQPAQTLSI